MQICNCDRDRKLAPLWNPGCPENIGQIQKIIFQNVYYSFPNRNGFERSVPPRRLEHWLTFFNKHDESRMTISPFIHNPAMSGGDVLTYGSGNQVLNGIPIAIGRNPIQFTCELQQIPQELIALMKLYSCNEIGVYFVDQYGTILCSKEVRPDLEGELYYGYYPFKVTSFFVSDAIVGAFDTPGINHLSFSLAPNWSDGLFIVKPIDFNPLYDLGTAETNQRLTMNDYAVFEGSMAATRRFRFELSKSVHVTGIDIDIIQSSTQTTWNKHFEMDKTLYEYDEEVNIGSTLDYQKTMLCQMKITYQDGSSSVTIKTDWVDVPASDPATLITVQSFFVSYEQGTNDIYSTMVLSAGAYIFNIKTIMEQSGKQPGMHTHTMGANSNGWSAYVPVPVAFDLETDGATFTVQQEISLLEGTQRSVIFTPVRTVTISNPAPEPEPDPDDD